MTLHHTSLPASAISVALVLASLIYVRGRHRLHASARAISPWRAASFVLGMFLVWIALGSPLVAYEHDLLTVHMIQHLLLIALAPGLILLGEPLLALWHGLPFGHGELCSLLRFALWAFRPTLCWMVSAVTLVAWHVPALFTLGLSSEVWHSFEQASFLGAGLLFWWPVVRPWPRASTGPQWSTLLYLFLATLPCDILSAFLVFSDRVAYPVYFSMPRHFGLAIVEDQQFAAALMWTVVTIVYLVPAAIISTRLLSPQPFYRDDRAREAFGGDATSHGVEVA